MLLILLLIVEYDICYCSKLVGKSTTISFGLYLKLHFDHFSEKYEQNDPCTFCMEQNENGPSLFFFIHFFY